MSVSKDSLYLQPGYEPKKTDLICRWYIEPAEGMSLEDAAANTVTESSIGTWTEIKTAKKYTQRLAAKVFRIDENTGIVDTAYPVEAYDPYDISCILASIAGNIFGMKCVNNLRLMDVRLPKEIVKAHQGPEFGIKGIRKLVKVPDRPLIGTIIKPKMGLNTKDHAQEAYDAWVGGVDIVKDDENLTGQKFNPFYKRVKETLKKRDRAERKTGERKMYMANVTAATTDEIIKRAEYVQKQGGEYIMIDVCIVGWPTLQTLREHNEDLGLVLHAHRAMHAAYTRNEKHGISMLVLSKFLRLCGLDQLHIGSMVGKMVDAGPQSVLRSRDALVGEDVPADDFAVGQKWYGMKSVFPVASGGLHPGHQPYLAKAFGNDVIIQMGGGIHGHPKGTVAGAKATRDMLDAVVGGIPPREYKSRELQLAIKTWGMTEDPV